MTEFSEHSLPCPCGDSSDAYAIRASGDGGFCFSCHKSFKNDGFQEKSIELEDTSDIDVTFDLYPYRGLTKKTVEFYNIQTRFHDGEPYSRGFVYPNGSVKAKRYSPDDRKGKYKWVGDGVLPGCYGMNLFPNASHKKIVITEGEDDAPSIYQVFGGTLASVSVQSSSSALRDISADRERINSFEQIIIAFDSDDAGRAALKKVVSAGLFDFNKVYYVDFKEYKDANEYLQNKDVTGLVSAVKSAKKYTPDNIINVFQEIEDALQTAKDDLLGTYPTQSLSDMLYGFHSGQVVVVKGLEGIGKTEIFRLMEYHLLRTTSIPIGLVHMEEDKSTTIKGIATYELSIPCALPDSGVSDSDIVKAYKKAVGDSEDRVYIYTLFGGDDPDDVLDSIRFLVTSCGVKILFLDHITMLVTGMEEGDERRKLDYLSTKLKKLAKELKFCLVFISHVNDEGQTRGSRNITKIADTVIHLSRDLMEEDEVQRNMLYVAVEKNRMAGRTGKVPPLYFNPDTFKLEEQV